MKKNPKKIVKPKRNVVYAVALKQPDGSWIPLFESMSFSRRGVVTYWKTTYGRRLDREKDQQIKRFYVGTQP